MDWPGRVILAQAGCPPGGGILLADQAGTAVSLKVIPPPSANSLSILANSPPLSKMIHVTIPTLAVQ